MADGVLVAPVTGDAVFALALAALDLAALDLAALDLPESATLVDAAAYGFVNAAVSAVLACSAALFGAADFIGVVFSTALFAAVLFAAVDFAAVAFTVGDVAAVVFAAGVDFAADCAAVSFLATGFLADGVACALGTLDIAGLAGVGIDGVESPELLVAIRTL